MPFPSSHPSSPPTRQMMPTPKKKWVCPVTLTHARSSPSKYHAATNAVFIFCQASPAASARSPTLPGPQAAFSRWGPSEDSASLSESSHPRRGSARRRVRSAKHTQPFSGNARGSTKASPLSLLPERWGRNLLLFLLNDMPESYRVLAMQLSITASQGGARTQGKPIAAQGKIYHTTAA